VAKLVLSLNGIVINQFFVDKDLISIGRDPANDIVINDVLLSREHARIVSVGEDHILEDLKSSNGTLVNGNPLVRQILRHRDIIKLGEHHLCFLNTKQSAEVDLDRTMMIKALPRTSLPTEEGAVVAIPSARTARIALPEGRVKVVVAGSNRHVAGEEVNLERVVTTFGQPGRQLVVITRRPQGFFLTHVEGAKHPRVNGESIGTEARALQHGDEIDAAGCRLKFRLGPAQAESTESLEPVV